LSRHLDIPGQSGTVYRYAAHEDGVLPWPGGGNALFIRMTEEGPTVVHAAESENLSQSLRDEWSETFGGEDLAIYIRLNVSRAARVQELTDILARHHSLEG
jgi:hypothetical protein